MSDYSDFRDQLLTAPDILKGYKAHQRLLRRKRIREALVRGFADFLYLLTLLCKKISAISR